MSETIVTTEAKQKGRKANPNSARQQRLALKVTLAEQGLTVQRGRKPKADSARQQRLAAFAQRIANGETVKRGRPKTKATEVA